MRSTYAVTSESLRIGSCCSALTADCWPTSMSCSGVKRLKLGCSFVCAFAIAAVTRIVIRGKARIHLHICFLMVLAGVACPTPATDPSGCSAGEVLHRSHAALDFRGDDDARDAGHQHRHADQ